MIATLQGHSLAQWGHCLANAAHVMNKVDE